MGHLIISSCQPQRVPVHNGRHSLRLRQKEFLNTNALEVLSYIHLRKICEEEGVSF